MLLLYPTLLIAWIIVPLPLQLSNRRLRILVYLSTNIRGIWEKNYAYIHSYQSTVRKLCGNFLADKLKSSNHLGT